MEGKVAVVNGAGRVMAREMALLLAAEGASVAVNDLGATVNGEGVDESVAESDSAKRIVDLAIGSFGRIDVLSWDPI
jgi:NAD(P)-dependent dehydrogenase (short-subunit alcohol dehydrogenase family)